MEILRKVVYCFVTSIICLPFCLLRPGKLEATVLLGLLLMIISLSTEDKSTTTDNQMPTLPPVALQDIGYDGTWQQFCDPEQINKDFAFYLEHELRVLRSVICDMKAENIITRDSMSPFIAYKYCEMMRFRVDDLLEKLVARLADEDSEKKNELLTERPNLRVTKCSNTTIEAFKTICIEEMNPFFRMFIPLLARACLSTWLTTDRILSCMKEVCANRKLTSNIDWQSIINTVPYRG